MCEEELYRVFERWSVLLAVQIVLRELPQLLVEARDFEASIFEVSRG